MDKNLVDSDYQYIDFSIHDEVSLKSLMTVVDEFKEQMKGHSNKADEHWLPYFREANLNEFWWPDKKELELWHKFSADSIANDRYNAFSPAPRLDFGSMVECILVSEYEIIRIKKLSNDIGRLEFSAYAYPYGGTEPLRMLIRSFGHSILGFDDGTGFMEGDPIAALWEPGMIVAPALESSMKFKQFFYKKNPIQILFKSFFK